MPHAPASGLLYCPALFGEYSLDLYSSSAYFIQSFIQKLPSASLFFNLKQNIIPTPITLYFLIQFYFSS